MDIISTYQEIGTYRGAAEVCGTTHKTVKRVVERSEQDLPEPAPRVRNYDGGSTNSVDGCRRQFQPAAFQVRQIGLGDSDHARQLFLGEYQ
jgi:hypothetical protein